MSSNETLGILAYTLASLLTQPLDYMKVQAQVKHANHYPENSRPLLLGRKAISQGGLTKLFVGYEALIVRSAIYHIVRSNIFLTLYNSSASKDMYNSVSTFDRALYSSIGSAIGGFVTSPFDLILLRKQVDNTLEKPREYKGLIDSFTKITKGGGVSNLWIGGSLNAFKYGFLALGMVPIYDQITEFWPRVLGEGFYIKPFCIGIASVSGALLSLPFDNIKTKYQRQVEKEYKSVADCYHKIIARESIFGLYTGFWHYAGRIGISSIFIVYFVDAVRDVLYSS